MSLQMLVWTWQLDHGSPPDRQPEIPKALVLPLKTRINCHIQNPASFLRMQPVRHLTWFSKGQSVTPGWPVQSGQTLSSQRLGCLSEAQSRWEGLPSTITPTPSSLSPDTKVSLVTLGRMWPAKLRFWGLHMENQLRWGEKTRQGWISHLLQIRLLRRRKI